MDELTYVMAPGTLDHLAQLVGRRWECVGTAGTVIDNLITCPSLIVTSDTTIALSILDNEVLADSEYQTLTLIEEVEPGASVDAAKNQGLVFFDGKGEQVVSVSVIREELREIAEGRETFRLLSDSGVVIALESMVIAIQRRGVDGFDFVVNRAPSVAELEFYPTDLDWPTNLGVTYEYARHLIHVG
jgi:hypothetical protein